MGGQALAQSYTPAPNPPPVSSVDGNGVDIVSGQISLITVFDVGIGGAGSGLSRSESSFGDTFRGVMDGSPSGSMTVVFQGRSEIFNNLTPTGGSNNTLSCSGTLCTYTLADGTAAVYDTTITTASQLSGNYATLTSITKPDGEVITLRYASFQVAIVYMGVPMTITIQHPATVTSSLGWMLKNHYPGDDITKQVVKVEAINASVDYCDPTTVTCPNESQTWPYVTVNGAGGPTDMLGNYTAFNGGMAKPTSIVSPSGVTKTITYYTSGAFSGRVYQVKVGNSTWTYAYGWSGVTWTNTVTDPNGGVRTLVYDSNLSQIVSDTDPMGRKTSYTYYATNGSGAFKGAVSQVINPDATWSGSTPTGGYTQYAYDARGNVTTVTTYPKGGGTPIIVRATYAASCSNIKTCNKPLTVTDANGIVTTYAYDSASGNVASVTLPAQANGIAPQTRYTYSQITPSYYTAPGVFTAQPAVSRLTSTSTCMTGQAPACVGTTDERRTTVYYGANNASPTYRNVLPVSQTVSLGDGTLAQTSTFTYDSHGNVTSVDGPKAGTVDTVYYFYDVLNRQIGMIGPDPDNSGPRPRTASKTTYDNDGRVSEVDVGTVTGTDTNALNAMTIVTRDTTTFDTATGVATIGRHFIGTASTPQNVT
ncbi:MAG: hypothetical protein JF615_05665, partial [Asticcacaulis sp.]|nr:hypothetical protein [Asticcacaulis sp.]